MVIETEIQKCIKHRVPEKSKAKCFCHLEQTWADFDRIWYTVFWV